MMEPLRITAVIDGPVSMGAPIAIDAMLAAVIAEEQGLIPPTCVADCLPIEIPIEREPEGRFHLASFALFEVAMRERRYVHRRFPVEEAQMLGTEINIIRITAGPGKSYRIPQEGIHPLHGRIAWYCVGDADPIRDLLAGIGHVGKKRAVGRGRVKLWSVEPCETWEGFPIVRDGQPLRSLPRDWPGLRAYTVMETRITYPYWLADGLEPCAVPLLP